MLSPQSLPVPVGAACGAEPPLSPPNLFEQVMAPGMLCRGRLPPLVGITEVKTLLLQGQDGASGLLSGGN